jgi:hypothetical protein
MLFVPDPPALAGQPFPALIDGTGPRTVT